MGGTQERNADRRTASTGRICHTDFGYSCAYGPLSRAMASDLVSQPHLLQYNTIDGLGYGTGQTLLPTCETSTLTLNLYSPGEREKPFFPTRAGIYCTKKLCTNRRDGLEIKSTGCSSKGLGFNSHHLHGSLHLSVTPILQGDGHFLGSVGTRHAHGA